MLLHATVRSSLFFQTKAKASSNSQVSTGQQYSSTYQVTTEWRQMMTTTVLGTNFHGCWWHLDIGYHRSLHPSHTEKNSANPRPTSSRLYVTSDILARSSLVPALHSFFEWYVARGQSHFSSDPSTEASSRATQDEQEGDDGNDTIDDRAGRYYLRRQLQR